MAKSTDKQTDSSGSNRSLLLFLAGLVGVFALLQVTNVIDLTTAQGLAKAMGGIISLIAVSYFIYILVAGGLNDSEKKRVVVLFTFLLASAMFWAGFEQQGSSLQIFSDRYTNLNLMGWEIPSSWFQSFNPAYILIFSPILATFWIFLANRDVSFPAPAKLATGLLLLGVGYLIMVIASKQAVAGQLTTPKTLVSPMFLTFTYLFHTLGELFLSPVGLSAFSKLAPKRYTSQLMGLWFVGTSLGNLIAGLFAGNFDEKNVGQMPDLFQSVAVFSLASGLVLLVFTKPLTKWMGGIR